MTAASVGVVVLEFLGPLCWLTGIRWLRRLSFGAFLSFHLYSGVIVGFFYTTLMLPLVAGAFLGFHEPLLAGWRFSRRHLPVLALFAAALTGSVCHYFIPGDVRLTGEGRYAGLFMFDANRSVRFETKIEKGSDLIVLQVYRRWRDPQTGKNTEFGVQCEVYQNGELAESMTIRDPLLVGDVIIFNPEMFNSARARISGDAYLYYYYARELVRRFQPDRVSLRLEVKLDGHPEAVTLLDIADFAALNPTYRSFGRNDWIKLPEPDSPPAYRWP